MKQLTNPLRPGDVIQTHPGRGFWGCAVVLTAQDRTQQFLPVSHIATTTLIFTRRFPWKSVDPASLKVVKLAPMVRVAPNEYYQGPVPRTCIGIYSLRSLAGLNIIGWVNPGDVYHEPLNFEVGDGTDGRFPLCGPIPKNLGSEAVIAWRMTHDRERFEREAAEARARFERHESQRLSQQRGLRSG